MPLRLKLSLPFPRLLVIRPITLTSMCMCQHHLRFQCPRPLSHRRPPCMARLFFAPLATLRTHVWSTFAATNGATPTSVLFRAHAGNLSLAVMCWPVTRPSVASYSAVRPKRRRPATVRQQRQSAHSAMCHALHVAAPAPSHGHAATETLSAIFQSTLPSPGLRPSTPLCSRRRRLSQAFLLTVRAKRARTRMLPLHLRRTLRISRNRHTWTAITCMQRRRRTMRSLPAMPMLQCLCACMTARCIPTVLRAQVAHPM